MKKKFASANSIEALSESIQAVNAYFLKKAQKQVNTALTLRNWLIDFCIVEYEQSGKDRADYGTNRNQWHITRALVKEWLKC